MAAISGTKTDNTASASFTPTNSVSDVVITNRGIGSQVRVEAMAPNTGWEFVSETTGAFPVLTSDPALLYRIRGVGTDIDFDYYMGP